MTAQWHKTNYRVPYKDTDRMGIVHHGNYINWFEIARTEFMRHYGIAYKEIESKGFSLPVANVDCRYKSSATFDDCIVLFTKIADYSPLKLKFVYEARKLSEEAESDHLDKIVSRPSGELIASGSTEHTWVNENFKPIRLNRSAPDIYEIIREYGEQE